MKGSNEQEGFAFWCSIYYLKLTSIWKMFSSQDEIFLSVSIMHSAWYLIIQMYSFCFIQYIIHQQQQRNPASEQSWGFCWCCRRQNRSVWASTARLTRRCWQKYKYDFAKILTATWIKYMQQQAGILTRKNGHAPHFCRWWQVLVPGEISSQPGVLKECDPVTPKHLQVDLLSSFKQKGH